MPFFVLEVGVSSKVTYCDFNGNQTKNLQLSNLLFQIPISFLGILSFSYRLPLKNSDRAKIHQAGNMKENKTKRPLPIQYIRYE